MQVRLDVADRPTDSQSYLDTMAIFLTTSSLVAFHQRPPPPPPRNFRSSFSKMNVLHWHLSDSQSVPFASAALPNLSVGAFSRDAVYTPQDVAGLAEYARLRGVSVVVEVDMPGHSWSLTAGYPEIGVDCPAMQPLETEFWTGGIDPSEPDLVYPFLDALLGEVRYVCVGLCACVCVCVMTKDAQAPKAHNTHSHLHTTA
jgi:hypothetical protein